MKDKPLNCRWARPTQWPSIWTCLTGSRAKPLHPAWEPGSTAFLHRVEEKRQNKPSLEHLPPIQVYSFSCFKRRQGHEINFYLFAAAGLFVFLVWPDYSVFWLHVKGLWAKSALMYKNISDSNQYLKTNVSKVRKGTWYNCQSQLEVDNSWIGFSLCQAKVCKLRTAISWVFRKSQWVT